MTTNIVVVYLLKFNKVYLLTFNYRLLIVLYSHIHLFAVSLKSKGEYIQQNIHTKYTKRGDRKKKT